MNRQKLEYGALIAISVLTAAGGIVAMAVRVEKGEQKACLGLVDFVCLCGRKEVARRCTTQKFPQLGPPEREASFVYR